MMVHSRSTLCAVGVFLHTDISKMARLLVSSRSVHYASPVDRQRGPPPRFPDDPDPTRPSAGHVSDDREPYGVADDGAVVGTVTGRVASPNSQGPAIAGVVVPRRQRHLSAVPNGMVVGDAYDSFVLSSYSSGSVLGLAVMVAIGIGMYFMIVRYAGSALAAIAPACAVVFVLVLGWLTRGEQLAFDHRNGCVWVISRRLAMHCFDPSRKHRTSYGSLTPPEVTEDPDDEHRVILKLTLADGAVCCVGDVTGKSGVQRQAMLDAWRAYVADLQELTASLPTAVVADGAHAATTMAPR